MFMYDVYSWMINCIIIYPNVHVHVCDYNHIFVSFSLVTDDPAILSSNGNCQYKMFLAPNEKVVLPFRYTKHTFSQNGTCSNWKEKIEVHVTILFMCTCTIDQFLKFEIFSWKTYCLCCLNCMWCTCIYITF